MVKSFLHLPKNVYLLFLAQIIGMSATSLISLTGGIIGADLAPTKELSTLPITSMVIGLAISIIPAAYVMKKLGRKKGFLISTFLAVFAALLAAFALTQHNFYLFCFSVILVGTNSAFVQQYRFAAIESVPDSIGSKAASLVLFAGVFSGFLGPEIAKHTNMLFSPIQYVGSFLILSGLYALVGIILLFIKDPKSHVHKEGNTNRPILTIVNNPYFLIAVLAGAVGYGLMSFIMTATPVHLHTISHHSFDDTAFVIQSHVIAMFLPSLITGILIERFGVFRVMLGGIASFFLTIIIGIQAIAIPTYWLELVLLGIGWNFLFISATVLLAKSYTGTERFKAQGVNDLVVILTQLTATFLAGNLLFSVGWVKLHYITLPVIMIMLLILILNRKNLVFQK